MEDKNIGRCLKKMAKAATELNKLLNDLDEHCMEKYGHTPSDIDNDEFIDSCTGSGGQCAGMTAKEFHESMVKSLELIGVTHDHQ